MRIPLRYCIRNIARRKTRTALTVLGIAFVVAISTVMFAFARGVTESLRGSGSPDNIIVIDKRAANETFSALDAGDVARLKGFTEVRRSAEGEPLMSPEVVHQVKIEIDGVKDLPGTVRGATQMIFKVNQQIRMVEGNTFGTGRKLIVGDLAHAALGVSKDALAVGKTIMMERVEWKIVGRFTAGKTALESMLVADLSDMLAAFKRSNYSSVTFQAADPGIVEAAVARLNAKTDIKVKAYTEEAYYAEMASGTERIIMLALAMAVIATVGGLVSGMNTMYASVMGRIREIGTLKVQGFGAGDILTAVLVESLMIAGLGAAIGCLLATFVNGMTIKVSAGAAAMIVDQQAIIGGALVAAAIGIIGALPPGIKGVRMKIVDALRFGG